MTIANPDIVNLKGRLARVDPRVSVNISQISTITSFSYLSEPPGLGYTVITLISDVKLYTVEPYPELTARVKEMRQVDGANALIEIATINRKLTEQS